MIVMEGGQLEAVPVVEYPVPDKVGIQVEHGLIVALAGPKHGHDAFKHGKVRDVHLNHLALHVGGNVFVNGAQLPEIPQKVG